MVKAAPTLRAILAVKPEVEAHEHGGNGPREDGGTRRDEFGCRLLGANEAARNASAPLEGSGTSQVRASAVATSRRSDSADGGAGIGFGEQSERPDGSR